MSYRHLSRIFSLAPRALFQPKTSFSLPSSVKTTRFYRPVPSSSLLFSKPDASAPSYNVIQKTGLQASIKNHSGALNSVLQILEKYGINLSYIQSRPSKSDKTYAITVYLEIEGDHSSPNMQQALSDLHSACLFVKIVDHYTIPWIPRRIQDLDPFVQETLDAGADLESDHPGFHDPEYRQRRADIAKIAQNYRSMEPIPRIKYTPAEVATWGATYKRLMELFSTHPCSQYQRIFPLLVENCGYREDNVPQLQDISDFLADCTGFRLRPIAGLLTSRHFLNGLAFRVFFSTQYIRHQSKPFYTPEPDIVHELMGHAPMFADSEFADFSQAIGLASLGASDEDILKLGTVYWFSIEFGLCRQGRDIKAMGAGCLSSFGELEYCLSSAPEKRPFDPFEACNQSYPITTYQPIYYVAESFSDASDKIDKFAKSLRRPFDVKYNSYSQTVDIVEKRQAIFGCDEPGYVRGNRS